MITLNDKWALKFSEVSVDLYERRINRKTNEEYFTPQYYYGSLNQALEGIIDRSLVDNYDSLKQVVDKINSLKSEIREFLKQINQ